MRDPKAEEQDGRGRFAVRPGEIPVRGWRDVLLRVKGQIAEDNLSVVAAGVAFYAMLAVFPALAALVSGYGLVANPADVQQQLSAVAGVLPAEAYSLLDKQLTAIVTKPQSALSLAAVAAILFALWSAAKGVKALIVALNIVYDETEKRGFLKLNAVAVCLTAGGIVFIGLALASVVVLPVVLEALGLGGIAETLIRLLRWPLLAAVVYIALTVLYRFGPNRTEAQWKWVSWGAILATALWLAASALFSFYVASFGNYNETYGSIGAVVVLLMWFYIGAYIVLLGAELNSEMEHQTRMDTTVARGRPMGQRGAYVADTLGKTP